MMISVGELSMHVVDRGTGPVVLLVHGFPLDHSMWSRQIDPLASSYRVIAPDLRGFGKSTAAGDIFTMQQFADDLAKLLDVLSIREPIVLCGLSMGGYIAMQFWRRHATRLRGLVLCDTKAAADTPEAAENRLKMAEKVLQKGSHVAAEAMLPKLFARHVPTEKAAIYESMRQLVLATKPESIAAAQRGMAERPEMREELRNLKIPTLLICGEQDAISPVEEMQQLADSIPGSTFAIIPGAGHMSPLEAADDFNRSLLAWLANVL